MKSKASPHNQKYNTLMIRLNALVFIATIGYALLDHFLGIEVGMYIYGGFLLFSIINLLLIRLGYTETSKIFALVTFNILLFLITSSEPFDTGMHLHFVSAGAVAIALYGYEQIVKSVAFVILAVSLDLIAFTTNISFFAWREVAPHQAHVFFIINTIIAAIVCVYILLLSSKIKFESELLLQQNEDVMRKQNERLIKVNTELDRFVYSASHDLRAPLSTLKGLINLSEVEVVPERKGDYLELMKKRIHSMDSFISEIIDYSRNSRLEIENKTVNVNTLLRTIVDDLQFIEGGDRIKIYWDVPVDMVLNSDEARLKIIFTNLISNAIKYREPNRAECWIKLQAGNINNQAKIMVEDNGLGIDKELQLRIFEMFFRAHAHSSGSGLGLYIVAETLSKLGGTISIDSINGKGSLFTVLLPFTSMKKEISV